MSAIFLIEIFFKMSCQFNKKRKVDLYDITKISNPTKPYVKNKYYEKKLKANDESEQTKPKYINHFYK